MSNLNTALCMAYLFFLIGCLPADAVEVADTVIPTTFEENTNEVDEEAITPSPEINNNPSAAVINQPTSKIEENLSSGSIQDLPESEGMPIYVEMIQTTLVPGSSSNDIMLNVGENTTFVYNPDSKTLLLQPTYTIDPSAEVLIGLSTIVKLPDLGYVKGELFQIPLSPDAPLTIAAVDQKTGSLTIEYDGKIYQLAPGQSRSFKKIGPDPQVPTLIITITNHGRPTAIETFPEDAGWR